MSPSADPGIPSASPLQGVPNFRDLGGMLNAEGRRVRRGVVYRSEVLSSLSEQDVATLEALRIGVVFDLRNPSERVATTTHWPRAADAVSVRVMPEELRVPGADMRQFVQGLRDATLDVCQVSELMLTTYRAMPTHFSGMLRSLFGTLARQADDAAALVHCTAGKDRTGFVCAMLLGALDVPVDVVMRDYLASARFYTTQRLLAQMEKLAGQALAPSLARAMAELAQVKASYLDVAWGEIAREWGSADAYLMDQAGLDGATRQRLRSRLLE